jgi:hypothetical protein
VAAGGDEHCACSLLLSLVLWVGCRRWWRAGEVVSHKCYRPAPHTQLHHST